MIHEKNSGHHILIIMELVSGFDDLKYQVRITNFYHPIYITECIGFCLYNGFR